MREKRLVKTSGEREERWLELRSERRNLSGESIEQIILKIENWSMN